MTTAMICSTEIGTRYFQAQLSNWSMRNLANRTLRFERMKMQNVVLTTNQTMGGMGQGPAGPLGTGT